MALAHFLIPGFKYEVTGGLLAGETVTIVDNHPFPDSDLARRRKITVKMSDGVEEYMLPRLLSDQPVGIDNPKLVAADEAEIVLPVASDLDMDVAAFDAGQAHAQMTATLASHKVRPITDPMDDRLDHLRPSMTTNLARTKLRKYINRTMKNGQTDVEFLLTFTNDDYRAANELRPASVMLKGDTQSGKTMMVEVLAIEWAKKMGLPKPMPIFTLSGSSGVTDFDMFGQPTTNPDSDPGQRDLVWLFGVVDLAARAGGILYLDEINAMGERVTSSLHPLCDHRHQFINRNKAVLKGGLHFPEEVTGHQDLWILATYNEGYRGMGDMNEAFMNRFRHVRWDYDEVVEGKLIKSAAVITLGKALRTARAANTKGIRTPVGTAALQRLEQDVAAFGVEMGLEVFVGMFKAQEASTVEAIIEDRSIIILLQQEQEAARLSTV